MPTESHKKLPRPPVIAILGHIDHGKSTLLDYIRKTNVVATEAGQITQHLSAYEVIHKDKEGRERTITFLDTPGHEAFSAMRSRGISAADIVILVVSAEEGVKPQTLEALKAIKEAAIPYIVAINKIDKPNADIEKTKTNLLKNEIFLEGFGGDVPYVPISAKTGQGIPDLLDMMLLVADLAALESNPDTEARGVIIEANLDAKKGISATLIVKDGILRSGEFLVAGDAMAPTRIVEDFLGKPVREAGASKPLRVIGWNKMPEVGTPFLAYKKKPDAGGAVRNYIAPHEAAPPVSAENNEAVFPLIIKADTVGALDALLQELGKVPPDRVRIKVLQKGTGAVSESDIKFAQGVPGTVILGFNTPVDRAAADFASRNGIMIQQFNVIYELSKWVAEEFQRRRPVEKTEEVVGRAKVLKFFSAAKDRRVIGCRMNEGMFSVGQAVRIMRRDLNIGTGSIMNLQQQKADTKKVESGEFGADIKSKIEIAPGDALEAFVVVER